MYSIFHLTALGRTSSTILKRTGERAPPCLVPDISGKVLSFSPLSIMLGSYILNMSFENIT